MAPKRKRLGDLLVEAGIITEAVLQETLQTKRADQKLGDALVEHGHITEKELIEALEFQLGIPHISLSRYPIDTSLMKLVPVEFARKHILIPLRKEADTLHVAMNDPLDYFTLDDLRLSTGFKIFPVIASKDEIIQAINRYYKMQETMDRYTLETEEITGPEMTDEDAPAVKLVNQILENAIQKKASDIHIDPHEERIFVRFRIDGLLNTEGALPKKAQSQLLARIKIMANLNITESRLPQDGRIKINLANKPVDLRISTLPTIYGEKVVIRILDLSRALHNIAELGLNKVNFQRFKALIEKPSGIILITGPTGSGKSSTLYAVLNQLNSEEVNIITIEDPVEYQLEGINQVQVNPNIGLTFAAGLRSILRQDPNIVMIGEIRDTETAEIAIRASLTGHLVLSTLHTNSAIAAIPRLIDMGVEPVLVVSSLTGIVAQRLVRKICQRCKTAYEPTQMEIELFQKRGIKPGTIYRGKGCGFCGDTGYYGRLAIHEVLVVDDEIRKLMMNNQPLSALRSYALKAGMIFLIDDGLLKVKQGLTTMEEVLRVATSD